MTRRQFLRKYNGSEHCLMSQVVFSCTCSSMEVCSLKVMGLNGKLFLVAFLLFSKLSVLQNIPLNGLFLPSIRWKNYLSTNAFRTLTKMRYLVLKIISPSCFSFIMGIFVPSYIYLVYGKQDAKGKLLMAIFSPLIGVVLEVISPLCVQRLWCITHPGYSFVL